MLSKIKTIYLLGYGYFNQETLIYLPSMVKTEAAIGLVNLYYVAIKNKLKYYLILLLLILTQKIVEKIFTTLTKFIIHLLSFIMRVIIRKSNGMVFMLKKINGKIEFLSKFLSILEKLNFSEYFVLTNIAKYALEEFHRNGSINCNGMYKLANRRNRMTIEFNEILLYTDANGKVKIEVIAWRNKIISARSGFAWNYSECSCAGHS